MAAAIVAYELRYRIADSGQPWTVVRLPPEATAIELTNLVRDEEYEGEARSLGSNGRASAWEAFTWTVDASHEGAAALPPVSIGNVGSRWVSGTEATWAAAETEATISVTAGDLQVGDTTISYGASSAEIVGVADEVRTIHLYYDDPKLVGGTRTLGVTEDLVASMSDYGRIYIATLTVTFDSVGGTGTGGGGDIGGGGGGAGQIEP